MKLKLTQIFLFLKIYFNFLLYLLHSFFNFSRTFCKNVIHQTFLEILEIQRKSKQLILGCFLRCIPSTCRFAFSSFSSVLGSSLFRGSSAFAVIFGENLNVFSAICSRSALGLGFSFSILSSDNISAKMSSSKT